MFSICRIVFRKQKIKEYRPYLQNLSENTYRKFMLFILFFPTYVSVFSNTAHKKRKKKKKSLQSVHGIIQQYAIRSFSNSSRFQQCFDVLSHRKSNLVKVMDAEIQNAFPEDVMKVTNRNHL